jgi:hypothetical protein
MSTSNKSLLIVALSLLLVAGGSVYSAGAQALPITWMLQGVTFDDGGTASGDFTLNQYGFLSSSSIITTSVVNGFSGNTYLFPGGSINPNFDASPPNTFRITFQADSTHALSLDFLYTLDLNNSTINPLKLNLSSSFECEGSYSCYNGSGGTIRYAISGGAVPAPEPTTLGLLLIGAAGAVAQMRARKQRARIL